MAHLGEIVDILLSLITIENDFQREQAIAEREARMLVSDLLEISMIQRKAYEEKKAAADPASAAP